MDDVVRLLDGVIDEARTTGHRRGYFAAVYRQMSRAVRDGIAAGRFDDGPRMDRFATIFANRYFDALNTFTSGGDPTRSWQAAFACAERNDRLILQHVVLGINAHVNLDLGVAAGEVASGEAIAGLKGDFERINGLIAGLVDSIQEAIGRFSPLLDLLWRVSEGPDDEVLNFSFRVAREEAWKRASLLAMLAPEARPPVIDSIDRGTVLLARLVIDPGGLVGRAVSIVDHLEKEDPAAVIDALCQTVPASVPPG
jgi:hypothetical protein